MVHITTAISTFKILSWLILRQNIDSLCVVAWIYLVLSMG